MAVVVVVPVHNEEDRLPACLASVAAAAARVDVPVTTVVVLDACTDGSASVVHGGVRTVTIAAANVGVARATGFMSVADMVPSRTWLATTDADSQVPSDWIMRQLVHHRNGAAAVVGTVQVDWRDHDAVTRLEYELRYRGADDEAPHGHVHGANLGIHAEAYHRVGGFRPLRVGEDVDLVDRLTRTGARIEWDRHNAVLTADRKDFRIRGGFGDYVNNLMPAS